MFGIGVQEMAFLAIIALLVFGPKRLPELARTLGKGMAEFRRASADLRGALSLEPDPNPRSSTTPTQKRQDADADPLADRDFSSVPDQSIGGPDPSAEAANQALLDDEANDTAHQDRDDEANDTAHQGGEGDAAETAHRDGATAEEDAAGEPSPDAPRKNERND